MIHDVDETLRAWLLRDALNGSAVEVSFEAPTSEWGARRQGPTLNVYLYDIREDLGRRVHQWEDHRGSDGVVVDRRLPPRLFKLAYLVTAWTQRAEDEHRLLSAALSCFLRADALPADLLQGSLAGLTQPVRATIGLPSAQGGPISEVWTALGGELKPSLDLVVTAPFELGRSQPFGPPVSAEGPVISVLGAGAAAGAAERAGGARPSRPPPQRRKSRGRRR
jgi:hypothetical protein